MLKFNVIKLSVFMHPNCNMMEQHYLMKILKIVQLIRQINSQSMQNYNFVLVNLKVKEKSF